LGGEIEISSRPGEGTEVMVKIPLGRDIQGGNRR